MNTPNNRRRRASQEKLIAAFVRLLQINDLHKITVTDLCRLAGVNRTTFYANYRDVYDLADAVRQRLEEDVAGLYREEQEQEYDSSFLKLFRHIKENQMVYQTYFKLGWDGTYQITEYNIQQAAVYHGSLHTEYHIEFFRNGLNAIIKKWLKNNCRETPEEMAAVIASEYKNRGQ